MSETATNHDVGGPDATTTAAERPSMRVIEAVAAAADEDPLEMTPLYDVIDPEALDSLFTAGVGGHVEFRYEGHDVTVRSDGHVVVEDRGGE